MNISPRDEKIKKSAHKNKKKVGIFLRPLMEYPEIEEKKTVLLVYRNVFIKYISILLQKRFGILDLHCDVLAFETDGQAKRIEIICVVVKLRNKYGHSPYRKSQVHLHIRQLMHT